MQYKKHQAICVPKGIVLVCNLPVYLPCVNHSTSNQPCLEIMKLLRGCHNKFNSKLYIAMGIICVTAIQPHNKIYFSSNH